MRQTTTPPELRRDELIANEEIRTEGKNYSVELRRNRHGLFVKLGEINYRNNHRGDVRIPLENVEAVLAALLRVSEAVQPGPAGVLSSGAGIL